VPTYGSSAYGSGTFEDAAIGGYGAGTYGSGTYGPTVGAAGFRSPLFFLGLAPGDAANGVTINCAVGNAAAAGAVATIAAGATISCSVGDAMAEGLICDVVSSITIDCAVGNATAAGASATITDFVSTLTAAEIADAVWDEPLAGATQARQIMSGMADFLRSRGFLP
jgi:hypothetical protein